MVRLSFAEGRLETRAELDRRIRSLLAHNARTLGVEVPLDADIAETFICLIKGAHARYGQRVVVLVDEYDKPILDNLTTPKVARAMREGLRNLYSVIKGQDAHVRFAFLTGVSKFSKVSIFSGLNNLRDITVSAEYSAICGYTEEDLDAVFAPELEGLDREPGSATGTTATTGWEKRFITPSTCCFFFKSANFAPTGSKRARPPFWSMSSCSGASLPRSLRARSPRKRSFRRSTSTRWRQRRSCGRPGT